MTAEREHDIDRYEGEHVLIIGNDFLRDDIDAGCSCGWEQDGLADEEAAVDAWENHCDVVFMEATGG